MSEAGEILIGKDANRPLESVAERLLWAYGPESVSDLALVTMMEPVDYRGQPRGVVMADCIDALGDAAKR
jgi:hypothetical protein